MQKIAASIREGANAYLKRQYTTVAKVFAVVFVILLIIAFASGGKMLSRFTPFAFLTGGIWSMLAGLIGMKIATNSNARTAQAASESLNKGLRVAFSSGSVMGFTVVGLGILDISIWFTLLYFAFGITDPVEIGTIMVMNGMGASFMALFARVGGGIYTARKFFKKILGNFACRQLRFRVFHKVPVFWLPLFIHLGRLPLYRTPDLKSSGFFCEKCPQTAV